MSATATAPAPAPDGTAAAPPKKGSRRLVLVAVGVLVLGALGAGGYLFLGGGAEDAAAEPVEEVPVDGPVVEVGTLTTNLAGSTRYARVGIALVLTADADATAVESRFALVKDAAISEIGSHTAETLQAATGTEQLRAGLAERIVPLFPDGEVSRVVLTELLVQ